MCCLWPTPICPLGSSTDSKAPKIRQSFPKGETAGFFSRYRAAVSFNHPLGWFGGSPELCCQRNPTLAENPVVQNFILSYRKLDFQSSLTRGDRALRRLFYFIGNCCPIEQKSSARIALRRRGIISLKRFTAGGESCEAGFFFIGCSFHSVCQRQG